MAERLGDSYTTLWSQDRIRDLKRHRQEGVRLTVLFGGPHTSLPAFRRYGVHEGDWIYPIYVRQGVLHVIGRMRVRRILSLEDYIAENPDLFAGCAQEPAPMLTLLDYLEHHPEQRYLAPTCVEEVALGEQGTPIRLDVAAPGELVERLRFRSRRRERGIKHVENGRIKRVISLQGIYRLAPESAEALEALLARRPAEIADDGGGSPN
jgi:hypothetical protein